LPSHKQGIIRPGQRLQLVTGRPSPASKTGLQARELFIFP